MPTKTNIDVLYAKAQTLVADVMTTTAGASGASKSALPQEPPMDGMPG